MSGHTKRPHIKRKTQWKDIAAEELAVRTEQGLYLRGIRQREGLTQKELSEKYAVSKSCIKHICSRRAWKHLEV